MVFHAPNLMRWWKDTDMAIVQQLAAIDFEPNRALLKRQRVLAEKTRLL